jgi:hypothetical protein
MQVRHRYHRDTLVTSTVVTLDSMDAVWKTCREDRKPGANPISKTNLIEHMQYESARAANVPDILRT